MRTWVWTTLFAITLSGVACGGKEKAKDPSDTGKPAASDEPPKWEGPSSTPPDAPATTGQSPAEGPKQRADQYDKEATEVVLKRAARQVKANCGAATDENGKAIGPWGKVTIQVNLGRNGHSKGVAVPPPYQGRPPGNCIEKAFANLTFPPWAGTDTTVDWEVELVQPGQPGK